MKTRIPVFLSLLLLSFMVTAGWGQATTVHSSDFNTSQGETFTTSGEIGDSDWFVSRSGDDWGARIHNGILE